MPLALDDLLADPNFRTLGYPRRGLTLSEAAQRIRESQSDQPSTLPFSPQFEAGERIQLPNPLLREPVDFARQGQAEIAAQVPLWKTAAQRLNRANPALAAMEQIAKPNRMGSQAGFMGDAMGGMALPSVTPPVPASPVGRLAAIGARGPVIGRPPLGATRSAGDSSQLGDLVNQIYGTPMGKAAAAVPASAASAPQVGAPSEGILADPNFSTLSATASIPQPGTAMPVLTTSPEWERIAAKLSGRVDPIRAAEIAAMPATPSESSPLSQALGRPYGTQIIGDQIVTRRPMIGGGGYIETSAPGDPRSLAGRWAPGTGFIRDQNIERLLPEAVRYRGGIEQEQSRAQTARETAEKEAATRIETSKIAAEAQKAAAEIHARSAKEAAELQYGKDALKKRWSEEGRKLVETNFPNMREEAKADWVRSYIKRQEQDYAGLAESVGVKTPSADKKQVASQGDELPEQVLGREETLKKVAGKGKVDIDKLIEDLRPLAQEGRLSDVGMQKYLSGLTQTVGDKDKVTAALEKYLLSRALPLRLQSIGGIGIKREPSFLSPTAASIDSPTRGLYYPSVEPVPIKDESRTLEDLQIIARMLGGKPGDVVRAPAPVARPARFALGR